MGFRFRWKDVLPFVEAPVLLFRGMSKGDSRMRMRQIPQADQALASLDIKVIPNAPKTMVVGKDGGIWRIKVAGVPEDGRANRELIHWLAEKLGVSRSCVVLLKGEHARQKSLRIMGITQEVCESRLSIDCG